MVKFVLHFLFLVAAVAYLARRAERFYWRALAVFMAGIAANAAYGVVQLAAAEVAGGTSTSPCSSRSPAAPARSTSTARSRARSVYRPNALTGDPNHLGIMLILPLLVLTPIYLRLERGHRLRVPLGVAARVPARRRARDALAQRPARPRRRAARARGAVPPAPRLARAARSRSRGVAAALVAVVATPLGLLRDRAPLARRHDGGSARRRTSTSTASSRTCSPRTRCSASG